MIIFDIKTRSDQNSYDLIVGLTDFLSTCQNYTTTRVKLNTLFSDLLAP